MSAAHRHACILLVRRLRAMRRGRFDVPAHREELENLSQRMADLLDCLEGFSPIAQAVESAHDEQHGDAHFACALATLRELRDSTQRVIDALPHARTRPLPKFAAAVWLHLHVAHGGPVPKRSRTGSDVRQLQSLLEAGGYPLSPEAVRNLLRDALNEFDPTCPPPEVRAFLHEVERRQRVIFSRKKHP